jgi:hypothetical protein
MKWQTKTKREAKSSNNWHSSFEIIDEIFLFSWNLNISAILNFTAISNAAGFHFP